MHKALLALLLIGLIGGADSPREWDDATTMTMNLEGTWRLVGLTRGGQPDPNPGSWELVFGADKYSWDMGGRPVVVGTYNLNFARSPAQLDLKPNQSTTNRAICRMDGDKLTIALFEPENVRPRSFGDANLKVLTLQRVKKQIGANHSGEDFVGNWRPAADNKPSSSSLPHPVAEIRHVHAQQHAP